MDSRKLRSLLSLLLCFGCRSGVTLDAKIPVSGRALHVSCRGAGAPSVVLDAGLGQDARAWSRVQPEVAKFAKVCAYDRAGLGSSDPAPRPNSNRRMAVELHDLLANAEVPGPYVLVGHSMGGTNVRLFSSSYPTDVAGVVLVDSSPTPPPVAELPPQQVADFARNIDKMEGLDLKTFLAGFDELKASEHALGAKPLVILIAGQEQPEPFLDRERARQLFVERQEAQREMTRLSANSRVEIVRDSSHQIPLESPGSVVRAIRIVVESARGGTRLSNAAVN